MHRKEKLTKKLLLSLRTGNILSSNIYDRNSDDSYQSATLDIVPDHSDREALWQEIKRKKTNGRLCYIYDSNEAYEEHQKELNAIMGKS
nr:hypothetical protein [uncultured Pseudodesulfovibrio sp.]